MIYLVFLILFKAESNPIILPNYGVAVTISENPTRFHSGQTTVRLTRLYTSPIASIPLSLIKNALKSPDCKKIEREEAISHNLKRFQHGLKSEWESRISELMSYQMQPEPEQDSELSITAERIQSDARNRRDLSDFDFIGEKWDLENIRTPVRNRRELATLITIISSIASIIQTSISIANQVHANIAFRDFERRNSKILSEFSGDLANYASLSASISNDLDSLSSVLCSDSFESHKRDTAQLIQRISDDYIQKIQDEILNLHSSSLPKTMEFYSTVMSVCKDSKNTEEFCRFLINKGLIEFEWKSSAITKNRDIITVVHLRMPIQSSQFLDARTMNFLNIGFLNEGRHYTVDIPSKAIVVAGDKIFSLKPRKR